MKDLFAFILNYISDFSMHKEGRIFVIIGIIISVIALRFSFSFGFLCLLITLCVALFFRDPERVSPQDIDAIVAPADGKISAIEEVNAPEELGFSSDQKMKRISIFLSVFDIHVNRIPISGEITKAHYRSGSFVNAGDKDSENNEAQFLLIKTDSGEEVAVVQLAGLIARRIVCNAKQGDVVNAGDRFGIIRFGSRVDLYFPLDANISALIGQTAVGGETILARFEDNDKSLTDE